MQFSTQRNDLLSALQSVISVVERKQTMPILSCVLIDAKDDHLVITATDLELELITYCNATVTINGCSAIPARKLFDICRGLPGDADVNFDMHESRVRVRCGRARFLLSHMPGEDWPRIQDFESETRFEIAEKTLKQLLEKTEFAMAQQDVRYYLNGLMVTLRSDRVRCVATDGHRLALSEAEVDFQIDRPIEAIVPRKAVMELAKLLNTGSSSTVALQLSRNHMRLELPGLKFTTKLIDGRFPDYERVIPDNSDKRMTANRDLVRQALSRTAILSNEKFGGVRLALEEGRLTIQSQNIDKEEAEDELEVDYHDQPIVIGFNVHYLLEALSVMSSDEFTLDLSGESSSGLLQEQGDTNSRFVVMPMRL